MNSQDVTLQLHSRNSIEATSVIFRRHIGWSDAPCRVILRSFRIDAVFRACRSVSRPLLVRLSSACSIMSLVLLGFLFCRALRFSRCAVCSNVARLSRVLFTFCISLFDCLACLAFLVLLIFSSISRFSRWCSRWCFRIFKRCSRFFTVFIVSPVSRFSRCTPWCRNPFNATRHPCASYFCVSPSRLSEYFIIFLCFKRFSYVSRVVLLLSRSHFLHYHRILRFPRRCRQSYLCLQLFLGF